MEIDLVKQVEHRIDVLAQHQRLEVLDGPILHLTQIDLASVDDLPGLRFSVRPAQVLSGERTVRIGMDGQALAGIQQFDE